MGGSLEKVLSVCDAVHPEEQGWMHSWQALKPHLPSAIKGKKIEHDSSKKEISYPCLQQRHGIFNTALAWAVLLFAAPPTPLHTCGISSALHGASFPPLYERLLITVTSSKSKTRALWLNKYFGVFSIFSAVQEAIISKFLFYPYRLIQAFLYTHKVTQQEALCSRGALIIAPSALERGTSKLF